MLTPKARSPALLLGAKEVARLSVLIDKTNRKQPLTPQETQELNNLKLQYKQNSEAMAKKKLLMQRVVMIKDVMSVPRTIPPQIVWKWEIKVCSL